MTDRLKGKTLNGSLLDEFEKDEIKRKVDIVELFESFGVKLIKKGKNYTGLCPWHEDKNPSLSVDKEKGLFNCFGCGESGDIFTLTEQMKGYEFKEALSYLKNWKHSGPVRKEPALVPSAAEVNEKTKTEDKKQSLKAPEAKSSGETKQEITLSTVADYYHKKLYKNEKAADYMAIRGITNPNIYKTFKIGFADGTLHEKLSRKQKDDLINTGIIYWDGRDHFTGCVTFPIFDETGREVNMYGRSIDPEAEKGHLCLKGKHRGVFNRKASKVYDEIILTESIIDCLSLIELGFQNVQAIYGLNGFTDEHLETLKEDRVKRVVLGFDNDEPGIKGSLELKEKLIAEGFEVKIIYPPKVSGKDSKDWNDYLLSYGKKGLIDELIEKAEIHKPKEEESGQNFKATKDGLSYQFVTSDVTYRVTGIKEMFITNLRVNVKAALRLRSGNGIVEERLPSEAEAYYDNLDLYSARSRESYSRNLSREFGIEEKRVQKDLIKILEHLEKERDRELQGGKDEKPEMTAEEISLGMEFLRNENIFDEIVRDMEKLGYVGEDLNKKLLYIAASSRKLDDPISVMIISQSSSGKSMLVDTVKELMPPEDVIEATSLSDQALNYVRDMEHKFLVLSEAIHNDIVEHQLREIQSAKKLTRLVTMKDQKTGKMESALASVKAVVSMAMSSTKHEVNPENASRNFVIDADETKEQTRKIHEKQRRKYTLERYAEKTEDIPQIIQKHRSAQRLLRKIVIVNEFAKYLNFPDTLMRTRRDHERLIDLIAGIAFLRQFQKEEKLTETGTRFIECDLADYGLTYEIMQRVLSSSLRDISQATIELYESLRKLARSQAKKENLSPEEVSFTQRDIREFTGLGQNFIKIHLRILVEYEYIILIKGGKERTRGFYRLKKDDDIEKLDLSMIPMPEEMAKRLNHDAHD